MLEVGPQLARRQVDLADEERVAGARRAARRAPSPMSGALREWRCSSVACSGCSGQRRRARRRRVVAQLGVLQQAVDRVEAEAVDAALAPEAQHAGHRLAHLRVAPVEVGLLGIEGVQVPAAPVRGSRDHAGPPNVASQLFCGPSRSDHTYQSGCSRNHGCSIDVWHGHDVHQHAAGPRSCASATSASRSASVAEARVDVLVVADVVAAVGHRRRVDRRQPDARPRPASAMWSRRAADPAQVALAVAVGVLEGARVDLVDDGVLPPGAVGVRHGGHPTLGSCPSHSSASRTSELRVPGSEHVNHARPLARAGRCATSRSAHLPAGGRARGGGAPVVIPPFASDEPIEALLDRVDGVLPRRRPGHPPVASTAQEPHDAARPDRASGSTGFELGAGPPALERDLPMLVHLPRRRSAQRRARRHADPAPRGPPPDRGGPRHHARRAARARQPARARSLGDDRDRGQLVPPPGGRRARRRRCAPSRWADDGAGRGASRRRPRRSRRRPVARRGPDRLRASSARCSSAFVDAAARYRARAARVARRLKPRRRLSPQRRQPATARD